MTQLFPYVVPATQFATDSAGAPLPSGFDYLPQAFTYDVNGDLVTIVVTSGATTYTQTLSRDTNGKVTSVSAWVPGVLA